MPCHSYTAVLAQRTLLCMCSTLCHAQGYGGGFLYDGQYIVNNTNVILVSINYRLGAIGFLVYGEGSGAVKGNYGIQVSSGCEHEQWM